MRPGRAVSNFAGATMRNVHISDVKWTQFAENTTCTNAKKNDRPVSVKIRPRAIPTRLTSRPAMDGPLLRMGVDANRLYMRATSAGEDNHDVLQQAVDLRLKEWHGWMNSSDRASRLGAAQAAQALAVYFVSMHRYDDARMWLENALSQCSGDLLFEYRYWYINAMNSSLRELVLQQLLELKTTTGGAAARDDIDVQSREGAPQAI